MNWTGRPSSLITVHAAAAPLYRAEVTDQKDRAGDLPVGGAHDGEQAAAFSPEALTSELSQAAETDPGSERLASTQLRGVMKNAGVLLGGRSVNAVLSLGYLAISARAVGVDDFGVMVLINAFALAIGEIAKFQSWQAVLHYGTKPLTEGRLGAFQEVLKLSLMLDLLSALAGLAIGMGGAALAGQFLGWPPEARPVGMFYALSIVFMVTATPTGVLRLYDRFDILSAQQAISSLVRVVGCGAVYLFGGGLPALAVAWFAGQGAALIYLFGAMALELRRRGSLTGVRWLTLPKAKDFPGFWRFVWSTNLSATLDIAFTHVGTLVVGQHLGPAQAALFRIARQVADALAKPAKLVVAALYPELARLWAAGDVKGLRRLALQVGGAGGAIATLILVVAAFAGAPLLGLLLGAKFTAAGDLTTWLVASAAVGIWALPLEPLLISTGRAGLALRIRMLISALYLCALFPAVRHYGLIGAGAADLVAAVLMLFGMLIPVLKWYRAPSAPSRP